MFEREFQFYLGMWFKQKKHPVVVTVGKLYVLGADIKLNVWNAAAGAFTQDKV